MIERLRLFFGADFLLDMLPIALPKEFSPSGVRMRV
jgi:hypothetical protein